MNMLLALFIFIGISYGKIEISTDDPLYGNLTKNPYLMVVDAAPDSPAYKAGIVPGSVILTMKSNGVGAKLSTPESLSAFVGSHLNDAISISYKKPDGIISETTVAAVYGIVPDKKVIGISVQNVGTLDTNLIQAFDIGYRRTLSMTSTTLEGLATVVTSVFKGENVIKSLSGPIGIAKIVSQTSNYGYTAVLTLVAVLSINLAIFNILPLPALDGGRMVVVIIETIIRKKIPFKYYSWANIAGFSLLMLLLVIVTIHDIRG